MTTTPASESVATTEPEQLECISCQTSMLDIDANVIGQVSDLTLAATEPRRLGRHTSAHLVPAGFTLQLVDERQHGMPEPLPERRAGTFPFVGIASLGEYVGRYADGNTIGYVKDISEHGPVVLTRDTTVATYVLDDHPVEGTSLREHTATLVLRPTEAARRWGFALIKATLDQEQLLDLVVDGIGEIATPDGATLRDLVADLHAIRTTSVRQVIRTGGSATVEVADNVTLHGGHGNTIEIPEQIQIVLTPFTLIDCSVVVTVKIKPRIDRDGAITFALSTPDLAARIAEVLDDIQARLDEQSISRLHVLRVP